MNKPELLAPVGSPEALDAALAAGADAVYFGLDAFSARANAKNFAEDEAALAISRTRLFGVRSYAALNTLVYDRECEELLRRATALYQMGVSAVIVADLGAISLLRRHLPALEIHASTQASVHSLEGARALADLGVKRAVLAREMPLAEIRHFATHAPLETEIFVHGALCVCHSGQCLFSSLVGGRSGNRGECAQPCRLPYNGKYPLSLRDLSLADHVPALLSSGVHSLKIEGRMKSPAYVFGVTEIYRRLLDEGRAATPEENRRLADLFSRDGFTDAYFRGRAEEKMTGTRTREDKEASRALPPPPPLTRRVALTGELTVRRDEPARLTLSTASGLIATAEGEIPAPAIAAPLTEEGLCARIARLGGTDFILPDGALAVTLDGGLNLSPGAVNSLRRAATAALLSPPPARAIPAPTYTPARPQRSREGRRTVLCLRAAQADALSPFRGTRVSRNERIDALYLPLFEWKNAKSLPDGVYLPPVVFDGERAHVLTAMREAREAGIRLALCGNLGLWEVAQELGFEVMGDFRLNITNCESAAAWQARGVERFVLSPELTLPQLRDIGAGAAIVYGRIPLMLTERCFIRENFGCDACHSATLTDRRGVRFPLVREYPHRNLILNSRPTYMGDRREELLAHGLTDEHFLFTVETADEAARVFRNYANGAPFSGECRRIARR